MPAGIAPNAEDKVDALKLLSFNVGFAPSPELVSVILYLTLLKDKVESDPLYCPTPASNL